MSLQIQGHHILKGGEKVGYVQGNHIFNMQGHKLGYWEGDHLYHAADNSRLAKIHENKIVAKDGTAHHLDHAIEHLHSEALPDIAKVGIRHFFGSN